jgi:hypothetical protein
MEGMTSIGSSMSAMPQLASGAAYFGSSSSAMLFMGASGATLITFSLFTPSPTVPQR